MPTKPHPAKWKTFLQRYQRELHHKSPQLHLLQEKASEGALTLVYGSRDMEHNNAVVLKALLEHQAGE